MDLGKYFSAEDRSKKTLTQYKSLVRRLHSRVCGEDVALEDLEWLKDSGRVSKALEGLSPATRKLYMVPVMIMLKKEKMFETYVAYQEMFQKAGRDLRESNKEQTMTSRESKNWVTKEEVKVRIDELEKEIEEAQRRVVPVDRDGARSVLRHLCLNLYTQMPPLRNDFSNIKIMKPPYSIDSTKNFLYEQPPGKYVLYLAKYKTSRTYGKQKIEFPNSLNRVVKRSLELFPRSYLISKIDHPREPMSHNYLSVFMTSIFPHKKVGSSMLRKLYITDKFKGDHSLKERDELAKKMLHSRSVAQSCYEKHYK